MHLHLRDEDALAFTVPATARTFARAVVMPNLKPAITHIADAIAYRDRILAHVPAEHTFTPLMTLYLHPSISLHDIENAKKAGIIGVKLYPQGATTHAEQGVADLSQLFHLLEAMQAVDLPLLIHGEAVGKEVDIFDREKIFIDRQLLPLIKHFPELRVVLEHITTKEAVDTVINASSKLAATITPHHLIYDRNDMLAGGLNPHLYCMPILKRRPHREALIAAATSGNSRFFLGTDSAPHARSQKESPCGCAGVYSAPYALAAYATLFEAAGALDKLEGFASHFGADFYGLPRNTDKITLKRADQLIPETLPWVQDQSLVPMGAGNIFPWMISH